MKKVYIQPLTRKHDVDCESQILAGSPIRYKGQGGAYHQGGDATGTVTPTKGVGDEEETPNIPGTGDGSDFTLG